jgi:hypothetical protein
MISTLYPGYSGAGSADAARYRWAPLEPIDPFGSQGVSFPRPGTIWGISAFLPTIAGMKAHIRVDDSRGSTGHHPDGFVNKTNILAWVQN